MMLDRLVIDRNGSDSVGSQIANYLGEKIQSRELPRGEKLPSVREMTKVLNVGNHTVKEALEVLRQNKLIKTTQRGSFVADTTLPKNVIRNENNMTLDSTAQDIALVIPSIWRPRDAAIVDGISTELRKNNNSQHLLVFNTEADIDKQGNLIIEILDRGFEGVIFIAPVERETPGSHIRVLQKNNIPVVFCHRTVKGCSAPLVTFDSEQVGVVAGEALAQRGHRNIAYIAAYPYTSSLNMEKGLRKSLQKRGLELNKENVYYSQATDTYGHEKQLLEEKTAAIEKMLKKTDRPTAIYCFDSSAEILIYLIAQKLGLRVPDDLSILRYGKIYHDCVISNSFASIWGDPNSIGQLAAQVLDEIIEQKRPIDSNETIYVPIEFDANETLISF